MSDDDLKVYVNMVLARETIKCNEEKIDFLIEQNERLQIYLDSAGYVDASN